MQDRVELPSKTDNARNGEGGDVERMTTEGEPDGTPLSVESPTYDEAEPFLAYDDLTPTQKAQRLDRILPKIEPLIKPAVQQEESYEERVSRIVAETGVAREDVIAAISHLSDGVS
jgi:hypothetical protein